MKKNKSCLTAMELSAMRVLGDSKVIACRWGVQGDAREGNLKAGQVWNETCESEDQLDGGESGEGHT